MSNKNPFADVLKIWGCEKYADSFNWDQAISSSRQNAKAFGDAAKAATEGFQSIANRQAALIQKQAEEMSKFFSSFASAKNPEGALEQLTKAAKANTDSALSNSKEIFEVASKSASEATDILSKRFSAVMAECNNSNNNESASSSSSSEKPKKNAA